MSFESPDVEKEFPGLYASQGLDPDREYTGGDASWQRIKCSKRELGLNDWLSVISADASVSFRGSLAFALNV